MALTAIETRLVYLHNAVSDHQCLLFWPFTFSFNVNHASP